MFRLCSSVIHLSLFFGSTQLNVHVFSLRIVIRHLHLIQNRRLDPQTYIDKNGASLIHWAAGCGYLLLVQYLVEICSCSPHIGQKGKRSFSGRTPLHWAARNGHLDVVQYLVCSCHVDVEAATIDGTTAFCWACWQGHVHVMR